jgi:hypothetical protein
MKKVDKNSLPLRCFFCGQPTSSMHPYERSGQSICIGGHHLHNHERRPWNRRHLKRKKTLDCHKKKEEMETNPRSLQSNPKPLWTLLFIIGIFVYKTKESLGAPPLQTWGSSFFLVGPLAFSTLAFQHFIHKI